MTESTTPPHPDVALPLIRLFEGDSLDVLATIPDGTYTGFVTDPPYGLSAPPDALDVIVQWALTGDFVRGKGGRTKPPPPGLSEIAARFARTAGPGGFLGAKWDSFVPGPRMWREVFRTCKPGAIGAVFASPRTQHWMALALVLAGFEVIDTIGWIGSQGMAKSGTVDKRIDRRRHDRDVVLRCTKWIRERCEALGLKPRDLDAACGTNGMGSHWTSAKSQPYVPTREQWAKLEPLLGPMPPEMEAQRLIIEARAPGEDWAKREVVGKGRASQPGATVPVLNSNNEGYDLTLPATDTSAEWAGYSTQLAPGIEPIIIVRRPCEGTAVNNVLTHGCGAMNIDACRIESGADYHELQVTQGRNTMGSVGGDARAGASHGDGEASKFKPHALGKWPKNVMLSAEAAAILDDQVGERASGSRRAGVRNGMGYGGADGDGGPEITGSSGGPSRFFWVGPLATADDVDLPIRYVPKASKADRAAGLPNDAKNVHPTVKPPALMEWLCRLVGHPRGRLLDPFAGSGTTLRAARKLGLPCDGVERDHHYCIDLAAPRAGIDPGDVRRVDPPAPLADLPPPPAHPLPVPDEPALRVGAPPSSPVLGDVRVPSLEIPLQPRFAVDDFAGVPPMFPRLPGALETT